MWTNLVAICVIWTGVTNDNTCIKYLESVLQATFIGISYSSVHGAITVYEYDTILIAYTMVPNLSLTMYRFSIPTDEHAPLQHFNR